MLRQKTIRHETTLKGIGLHTGKESIITFKSAPENYGCVFFRNDLEGKKVEAKVEFVYDTKRGTSLQKDGVSINTSEHVLAAVAGLEINNLIIELNCSEPPIMDGSSKYFLEALEDAGIVEQNAPVEEYIVSRNISFKDEDTGSEILLIPADEYQILTTIDFGTKILNTQNATLNKISDFKNEIAASRTFSFLHDLELMLDNGIIKGGDLSNAIIYVDDAISEKTMKKLKKSFKQENINIGENGILNNLELRWPNEAARHKLLDIIGDFALIGIRIRGKIIANKPGHKINTDFAKYLSKIIKKEKRKTIPNYDLNAPPLMDIIDIMKLLPHRPPFLLVDKILELTEDTIVGVKNVSMNEFFFVGHFPGKPVMPGVLQIEAMAQCGGILALNTVPDPENYLTYFMKMDKVKFKQKILPGDTLIFKLKLLSPIRRGICHMESIAYANNKIAAEAELVAQIVKEI